LLLLACAISAHAQEGRWHDSFFVEGAAQHYFTPGIFSELVKPAAGFRAALGYEWRHFRFAVESGYTRITGTNPLVLDIKLAPLVFKAGYELPIQWGLGLQADLDFGCAFSRTAHYDSVLNMLKKISLDSPAASPFAGARLYAAYTFPFKFLKLYAGGGLDMILETGGAIPLPVIEGGLSVKPLAIIRPKAERPGKKTGLKETAAEDGAWEAGVEMPKAADIVFAHTQKNMVVREDGRGRTSIRLLNAVYFEANSVAMLERYRPVLNEAGERLRSNPSLRMTLRAYAAPFGTVDGQVAVSAARAWYCVEYYMKNYGIAEARMKIEYYGAEKEPVWKDASWESYRCVELILE
jgi:outer membrane protein OmpA-like peptidoglycan-associated protein